MVNETFTMQKEKQVNNDYYCNEHKMLVSRVDDLRESFYGFNKEMQCEMRKVQNSLAGLQATIEQTLKTFERFLKEQKVFEEKFSGVMDEMEKGLNRKVTDVEKRVDNIEKQIDNLKGALNLIKWLVSFLATSGGLSLLYILDKALHWGVK